MNRLISIIISLSLICTCYICNISVGASEDVPTEYGTIPAEYADASLYPVVVFKKDGSFFKGMSIFSDNTSSCGMYWIRGDNSGNQGKYILLRGDVTAAKYPNINYHYNQPNIVDLGGHTVTLSSTYMIEVRQRFAKNVNITFRNGTIECPDKFFYYGDNSSWTGTAKFNFTFENITFRLSEGSTSASAIMSGDAGEDVVSGDMIFDNCIFDVRQKDLSTDTTLFNTVIPSVENNIIVNGGEILASDCQSLKIISEDSASGSVVFNPNETGDYTTLTIPSSASAPDEIIPADGGDAVYVLADDDGENATYILKADFIDIPDVIVNRVEFSETEGTKYANAVVRNMTESEKNIAVIAAAYDENNVICSVAMIEKTVTDVCNAELELDASAENYAVFVLNVSETLSPVDGITYTFSPDWKPSDSEPKASTSNTYLNAGYDVATETIVITGEGFGANGDVLCVNVAEADEELSEANPPVISAMYHWNDNGTVNVSIPVSENIASGKYSIILSGDGIEKNNVTNVLIFRQDSTETQTALSLVNDNDTYSDFHNQITLHSFALGIDYLSENNWSTITKVMYGVKCAEGDFSVDSLSFAADYGRAVSMLESGDKIEDVMQAYSAVFKTSYDQYASLPGGVKSQLNNLISNSDFYSGYVDYSTMLSVAKVSGSSSFEELKALIFESSEVYGADLNGDYKTLSVNDTGKVFKKMFSERENFKTIADIADSFENAVEYYIYESQNNYGSSGGSSGGSSSGKKPSGGISFGGGSGSTSITTPSVESSVQPTVVPPVAETTEKYTDIKGHFAHDDIMYLSESGIISGYDDGTYRPYGNVTRAELCKIIYHAFDIKSTQATSFEDVLSDSWYYDYVTALADSGIVYGDSGKFRPNDTITRQDCAVILYRVLSHIGKKIDGNHSFADSSLVSDYAKQAVSALGFAGIMNGDSNGFRPNDTLSRGELACVVARVKKGA